MVQRFLQRSARRFSSLAPPTTGVRGDGIDVSKVLPLLHKAGAIKSPDVPVEISQFAHGQSNPTYLLGLDGGAQKLVLRKQPPGKLLRGAHAVDREYACMTALGEKTNVPVPTMRLFVDDAEVLGTPFFVCDYVSGRFFDDPLCTGASSPQEVGALYGGFLSAIAKLHTADYKAAGLSSFGKEGGYVARQTKVRSHQGRRGPASHSASLPRLPHRTTFSMHSPLPALIDRCTMRAALCVPHCACRTVRAALCATGVDGAVPRGGDRHQRGL